MSLCNKVLSVKNFNEDDSIIDAVCNYLKMDRPAFYGETLADNIREICVYRLCKSIGIRRDCNFRSDFLYFFSSFVGEAVVQNLNIKMHIANDVTRLFRHDGVNLVEGAKFCLKNTDIDEAFIDAFNFADKYRYLIPRLKD